MVTILGVWNPRKWPWTTLDLEVDETAAGRLVRGQWSVSNRRHGVSTGDRFFLLKVGEEPRGIVASGIVVRPPFPGDHWNGVPGRTTNYVEVDFDRILDPEDVLPVQLLESELPRTHWRPQGGGTSVAASEEQHLEQLWETHAP